jgi:hypothetical protein
MPFRLDIDRRWLKRVGLLPQLRWKIRRHSGEGAKERASRRRGASISAVLLVLAAPPGIVEILALGF